MKSNLICLVGGFALALMLGFGTTTVNDVVNYSDLSVQDNGKSQFIVTCGGADDYRAEISLKAPDGQIRGRLVSWTTADSGTSCTFSGHATQSVTATCATNKTLFESTLSTWCSQADAHSNTVLSN